MLHKEMKKFNLRNLIKLNKKEREFINGNRKVKRLIDTYNLDAIIAVGYRVNSKNATDDLLKFRRKKNLDNSGNISHKQAIEKAESEYEKYRVIQDQIYISSMDEFYNKYLEENKNGGK